MLNGSIELTSEINKGSVFSVALPIFNVYDENINKSETSETSDMLEAFDAFYKKVLIVDDNKINFDVQNFYLEKLNIEGVRAVDGENALEILSEAKPLEYDLIIMDVNMPIKNGIETTYDIRSGLVGDHYKKIPIIGLTGDSMNDTRVKCIDSGMNNLLLKPIGFDEFKSALLFQAKTTFIYTSSFYLGANISNVMSIEEKVILEKENVTFSEENLLSNINDSVITKKFNDNNIWYYDDFLDLVGDNIDLKKMLLNSFKTSIDKFIEKLDVALTEKKYTDLQQIVHTVKGSAGQLCFKKLEHSCFIFLQKITELSSNENLYDSVSDLKNNCYEVQAILINETKNI